MRKMNLDQIPSLDLCAPAEARTDVKMTSKLTARSAAGIMPSTPGTFPQDNWRHPSRPGSPSLSGSHSAGEGPVVEITYIGHATALLDFGRTRVLTDPLLRDRVMFLQRHGQNPSTDLINGSVPEIVLLSHLHYDHADIPSLSRLPATSTVVAPRGSGRYLSRWAGVEVHELVEGDTVHIGDVEINALPADHGMAFSVPRPMTVSIGPTP